MLLCFIKNGIQYAAFSDLIFVIEYQVSKILLHVAIIHCSSFIPLVCNISLRKLGRFDPLAALCQPLL